MAPLADDTCRRGPGLAPFMVLCSLLFLLVGTASLGWLFRTESVDNDALGLISYRFRWGRLKTISVDSNRDGLIDGKMNVVSYTDRIGSTHFDDYTEGWESSKQNGQWDIHYWKDETSGLFFLELDMDGDRIFESHFEGDDAEKELLRIR